MKNLSIFFIHTLLTFLFSANSHAFMIISSKTTVSPGFEGGVLSSSFTTVVNNFPRSEESQTEEFQMDVTEIEREEQ